MLDAYGVRLFEKAGTLYCVQDVSRYNESLGTKFADGDKIYVYTCDSILAEEQLLGNHGFRRVNDPGEYHGLYQLRPHMFVEVGTDRRTRHFNCSMHPKVTVGQKGKCPICGMDLVPVPARQGEAQPEN